MSQELIFKERRLRVCFWNATPGFVSASLMSIERELRELIQVDLMTLPSLDDVNHLPCDLLMIAATGYDDEEFRTWMRSLSHRIPKNHGISVPALIFAEISVVTQRELIRWAVEGNWYFDLIQPDQMNSLPMRVANFLRLHDHLHEIRRMSEQLNTLESKIKGLESQLLTLVHHSQKELGPT